ncbi:hypothetical protein BYT27DRAFT_7097079 [Phlegmacium glaucopus]|nr:hypothetical protein BYT27DRAFT_7097079 [Phlegmacium glaucopus]
MDDLAQQTYTLDDFCTTAKRLHKLDDMAPFVRFVLCGIYQDDFEQHQAIIDPIQNRLHAGYPITGLRDFDSLLGIDKHIRVRSPLTVFPVARMQDTLHTNVHLSYSFHHDTVPIHKIPNLCLAKWGTHDMIRVLFPALCGDGHSAYLTQGEQAIFYEKGLRPAVVELLGSSAADWPPDYKSEMFRARGHSGQLAFISKMLPEWHVRPLGDQIRKHLLANQVTWGAGLVFLHQIRGVKNASQHHPSSQASTLALDEWLDDHAIWSADLPKGQWWIDVGLEISSGLDECLAWRTDSHFHVVQEVLGITERPAKRITSMTSTKYARDLTSHLTAVSGCRISPGTRAQGRYEAQYLQLYTTDKSITYRPDMGHHGKFITGQDVLAGKWESYCENLYRVYHAAIKENFSLARMEVRVPIEYASDVLLNLSDLDICEWLVSFPPVEWWCVLCAYRVLAFKYVFDWQSTGAGLNRTRKEAILLTAAGTWLLNGLHSTPDDRLASRELMTAILPHVDGVGADPNTLAFKVRTSGWREDEEGEEEGEEEEEDSDSTDSDDSHAPARPTRPTANTLPYNPYGLVFLRPIRVGSKYPVPRFQKSPPGLHLMLSAKSFLYFFGMKYDDMQEQLFQSTIVKKVNPERIPNKVHRTAHRHNWKNAEEKDLFRLARKGFKLPEPVVDEGSDMEVDPDDAQDHNDSDDGGIDTKLSKLWRQFLSDLIAKAPNPKNAGSPSYCKLSTEERGDVDEKVYKNRKVSEYWRDFQWKRSSENEWTLIFNRLWPEKGKILYGSVQNYKTASYYIGWTMLTSNSDQRTVDTMRKVIRKRFNLLYWMPHAQTDRIWHTKAAPGFQRCNDVDESQPAPRILINWTATMAPT